MASSEGAIAESLALLERAVYAGRAWYEDGPLMIPGRGISSYLYGICIISV